MDLGAEAYAAVFICSFGVGVCGWFLSFGPSYKANK